MAQERPVMAPVPLVTDDGTIKTPTIDLPFSSLASAEAREALRQATAEQFADRDRHCDSAQEFGRQASPPVRANR
jgi:hypothetical protein